MRLPLDTTRLIARIAWRNVRRNWRHSLAALGTMAVGFVALALFQGYLGELVRSQLDLVYSRNMVGDVMVRRRGAGERLARVEPWRYRLDEAEQKFLDRWIAAHPGEVKTRVRTLLVQGMAHAGGSTAEFWGWGYDLAEGEILRRGWAWNAWAGHPLRKDDRSGVLLGLSLGAILGCEASSTEPVMDPRTSTPLPVVRPFRCKQEHLTLTATSGYGRMNAVDAEVVGLTSSGAREFDERLLWLPLPFAQELASTSAITNYMIALHRPSDAPRLRAALGAEAQRAGFDLEVTDWQETEGADLLRRGLELLAVYRGLVVMVILIIAGAAVLTTMMKTVRERTREIGTMRSLGYRRHHLLAVFALEAVLLALHAGVVGLLLSAVITAAVNSAGVMYKAGLMAESIPLRIGYSPAAWGWGFFFLSLVAVTAALLAARKVTGMRIAAALAD